MATTLAPLFEGTLNAHQESGVRWLARRPKAVLADEVGLGKTITALALIDHLDCSGQLPRVGRQRLCTTLWLTDASLVEQTAEESRRFLPHCSVLSGNDPELGGGAKAQALRLKRYPHGVDILILSHELAHSRRQWLTHFQPSMLIVDEASKLKGRQAFFETVRELAQRTPRVLSMTATPLENDPTQLWNILAATDTPQLWSWRQFEKEFVTWRVGHVDQWGKERMVPDGWTARAPSTVRGYLTEVLLRRTATDAGLCLPAAIARGPVWVPLTRAQRIAYESASQGLPGFHQKQKAGLWAKADSPLVDALVRELDARGDQQAIVYCETLAMLDAVAARLESERVALVRVEGKNTEKERANAVAEFGDGAARVLLGSRVLERGLNLQRCRVLISLDSSWNPARERQREGRICRIGSCHETYEHIVLLPDTPQVRAKQATLERKARNAELVGL